MRMLRCGDAGLLIELDDLGQVLALHAALSGDPPPGVVELVPAARTVLLRLIPGTGLAPVERAIDRAWESAARPGAGRRPPGRGRPAAAEPGDERPRPPEDLAGRTSGSDHGELVEIPVVYDGPDLAEVGELTGLGAAGVAAAHAGTEWTVAFGGFAPGFGYLAGGDPRLRVRRRAAARTRVPAGSVALAGEFSGIYPRESPGGWQLIGRTTVRIFDLDRDPPALLRPGVRVRFTEAGR